MPDLQLGVKGQVIGSRKDSNFHIVRLVQNTAAFRLIVKLDAKPSLTTSRKATVCEQQLGLST